MSEPKLVTCDVDSWPHEEHTCGRDRCVNPRVEGECGGKVQAALRRAVKKLDKRLRGPAAGGNGKDGENT